jgi:hypothetical protein
MPYTGEDILENRYVKTFFKFIIFSLSLTCVLGAGTFGTWHVLAQSSGWLTKLSVASGTLGTYAILAGLGAHMALVLWFCLGLPSGPERCTWQEISTGLGIGALALFFLAAGTPFFADTEAPGTAQGAIELVGWIYGLLVGGTLISLFSGLATLRFTDSVVEASSELLDNAAYAVSAKLRARLNAS